MSTKNTSNERYFSTQATEQLEVYSSGSDKGILLFDPNDVVNEVFSVDGNGNMIITGDINLGGSIVPPVGGADNLGNHTATMNLLMSNNSITGVAVGSAGAPSVSFTGDADTGVYSSGADNIDLSAGGSQVFNATTSLTTLYGGGNRCLQGNSSNQVIVGATGTANEALTVEGVVSLDEVPAPGLTAGYGKIYASSVDGHLHYFNSAGIDVILDAEFAYFDPVRVATTASLTLASDVEAGDTIDGIVLVAGDRVLIKDQAGIQEPENGIYVVQGAGAPVRADDANSSSEFTLGTRVFVINGVTHGGQVWYVSTYPSTVGVDNWVWSIAPSGTGDVAGPGSSTDNAIARFDSTTGKVIQNSAVTVGDSGEIAGVNSITGTATFTMLSAGGFNSYQSANNTTKLFAGVAGNQTRVDVNNSAMNFFGPAGSNNFYMTDDDIYFINNGNDTVRSTATFTHLSNPTNGSEGLRITNTATTIRGNGVLGQTINASGQTALGTGGTPNELLTVDGVVSINETAEPTATATYGKIYLDSSDNELHHVNGSGANYQLSGLTSVVRVATTTALTLASDVEAGDTIDGVVLVADDRVLIKDQTGIQEPENGVYIVQGAGAPVRASDWNASADFGLGSAVYVKEGTANIATSWYVSTVPAVIDTNNWAWSQVTGSDNLGDHTATTNLNMANNSIVSLAQGAVGTPSLSFNGDPNTGLYSSAADTINISAGGVQNYLATGSERTIYHFDGTTAGVQLSNSSSNIRLYTHNGDVAVLVSDNTPTLINANNGNVAMSAGVGSTVLSANGNQCMSLNTSNQVIVGATGTANETLTVEGVLSLDEVAEPTLTAGYGKVYVDSSDNELHHVNGSGANYQLSGLNSVVRVATTTALTLASDVENGDTIDGVVLATGDRVLIKDQTGIQEPENGVYIVQGAGAPVRASDWNTSADFGLGSAVYVKEGTANIATSWYVSTVPAVIDTNNWIWSDASSGNVAGPVSAVDNGLATFDGTTGKIIQHNNGITVGDTGTMSNVGALTFKTTGNNSITANSAERVRFANAQNMWIWPDGDQAGNNGQIYFTTTSFQLNVDSAPANDGIYVAKSDLRLKVNANLAFEATTTKTDLSCNGVLGLTVAQTTGSVDFAGGKTNHAEVDATTSITLDGTKYLVEISSTAAVTVTLPTIGTDHFGREFMLVKTGAAGTITVNRSGSDQISDTGGAPATSTTLTTQYETKIFRAGGVTPGIWWVR